VSDLKSLKYFKMNSQNKTDKKVSKACVKSMETVNNEILLNDVAFGD